jgi:glycosyltransferase involved in cell wall biosynthesis
MMAADSPTVSVVLPSYNRANLLPQAIQSVLAQTCSSWELIVVDDGSNDGTEQTVRSFSSTRIKYLRHSLNRGAGCARNTGIQAARGSYVAFLDSDDEWLPEKLAKDVDTFESSDASLGLVYSGTALVDADGKSVQGVLPPMEGRVLQNLLRRNFINSCSSATVRRDVLRLVGGFDETLPTQQDWDLWLRIAKRFAVAHVDDCLVKRHLGPDRLSSSLSKIYEGKAAVIQKHRAEMPPDVLAAHISILAMLLLNYDIRRGRELAFEALGLNWKQPRTVAAVGISLLGTAMYRYMFSTITKAQHGAYVGRAVI